MINRHFLGLFKVFLKLSNLTGGAPFSWNSVEKKVTVEKSGLLICRYQCLFLALYAFYGIYVVATTDQEKDLNTFNLTLGFLFAVVIDIINFNLVALNRHKLAHLMTNILRFTLEIQSELKTYIIY